MEVFNTPLVADTLVADTQVVGNRVGAAGSRVGCSLAVVVGNQAGHKGWGWIERWGLHLRRSCFASAFAVVAASSSF